MTLATSQRATQTTTPYVGLRPFESRDSAFFFGRRTQVKKLLELLHLHRFLPVVGSSGCGKSSLIRAGLIPALRAGFLVQDRDQWNVATLTPGDSPLGRLTTELVRACFPGAPPSAPDALRFSIEEQGEGPLVEWLRVNLGTRKNLLLCVDQFEEIFAFRTLSSSKGEVADESATSAGPPGDVAADDDDDVARARTASRRNDADRFVALLLELARRPDLPVYIVLTMRSDFLGDCDVFRGLPEAMNETRYLVPRLTREQLAVAIEGPARLANAHLAPRLLDRMLNDIGDRPDQLPILQHALLRTWRHWRLRDPNGEGPLQPLDFELAGTLRQALSLDAEAALAKVDRDVARKIFQCLTDTDPRKRRVRRAATVAELQAVTERSVGEIARTLDEFCIEERHFLSLSGPSNDPRTRVAITHESLIRRWETLQTWVDEERDARDSFFDYAKRAHQRQLRSGALLTGLDLALARDWRMQFSPSPAWAARYVAQTDLSSVLAYIDDSRRTELLRNRLLLATVAGLIVALVVFTLILRTKVRQAEDERRNAVNAKNETKSSAERSEDLARLFVASRLTNTTEALSLLREVKHKSVPDFSEIASAVYGRGVAEVAITMGSSVRSVAYSPDGRRIAMGSEDNAVRIFNADGSGKPIVLRGHEDAVWSVAFSPDGQRIASASRDHTVRVWNANGVGAPLVLKGHENRVWSVAFSPDGQRIVSGAEDRTVRVWNADGSDAPLVLKGHENWVLCVRFSPDGRRIASSSDDRTIRVWNSDGSGEPLVLRGHESSVAALAFSPDGQHIASGSVDKSVRVWNSDGTGRPLVLAGHDNSVFAVAFSPDGQQIASGAADNTVRIWSADGTREPLVLSGHESWVVSVAFSPDGRHVASASNDSTLRVWSTDATRQPPVFRGHTEGVLSVAFSPNGQYVASGSGDSTIRVWKTDGSERPRTLKGHANWVLSVAFSPDGRHIVSGSSDHTVRIWNADGSGDSVVLKDHSKEVWSVAFSPDGSHFASGSEDTTIRVWNADGSGTPLVLSGHEREVWCVAYSPDGKQIASGSEDHTIRIWNSDGSGDPIVLRGHEQAVGAVAFSPDARRVVSVSIDGTIRLWNADGSGQSTVLDHEPGLRTVAFSPDGKLIVTGSTDGTVRVRNSDGSGTAFVQKSHDAGVFAVAFSPDGEHIASGSLDKTVRILPVRRDQLVQAILDASSQCLSPERRQELLFESPEVARQGADLCRAAQSSQSP